MIGSLKEFFYQAHCERDSPSSKRLYGGIAWVICQMCLVIACILSFINGDGITDVLKDMWEFDLITSAALLGLSTITGMFGNGKNVTIGNTTKITEEEKNDC